MGIGISKKPILKEVSSNEFLQSLGSFFSEADMMIEYKNTLYDISNGKINVSRTKNKRSRTDGLVDFEYFPNGVFQGIIEGKKVASNGEKTFLRVASQAFFYEFLEKRSEKVIIIATQNYVAWTFTDSPKTKKLIENLKPLYNKTKAVPSNVWNKDPEIKELFCNNPIEWKILYYSKNPLITTMVDDIYEQCIN